MATRKVQRDLYPREVCAVLIPGGVQDMVSWNIPCPCQEGWNKKAFEVPSNPKHSGILGFYDLCCCEKASEGWFFSNRVIIIGILSRPMPTFSSLSAQECGTKDGHVVGRAQY